MSLELGLAVLASILALLAVAATVLSARGGRAAAGTTEALVRHVEQVGAEVARLGQVQERLRLEMQRGREDSLRGLADVAQGLQGRLAHAHRELAEVKALGQARTRQLDRAADSLRRLREARSGPSS